jgi:hypothetical protein
VQPVTSAAVIQNGFDEVGVIGDFREIVLSTGEWREGVVVPYMPAHLDVRGQELDYAINPLLQVLVAVVP